MNSQPRKALVTGGAVRIGRAICEELTAQGNTVVIHCNQSTREAEALKQAIATRGGAAHIVQRELQSQADCEHVIEEAWALAGGLDILVNNAAIFHKQALLDATGTDFETMWRVNALVPMMLTRAFALRRNETPGGVVINLLDRRITANETGCLPYLLSKKTLADFTRNAALELAPAIRVNAVAPGAILPPPRSAVPIKDLAGHVPLDRQCTPEDVARAIRFLIESDTITGQILYVDGGQHLCAGRQACMHAEPLRSETATRGTYPSQDDDHNE